MLLKTPCGVGDSNNPGAGTGNPCGVSKTMAGEAKDRKITVLKASPVMDGQTVTEAIQEGLNDRNCSELVGKSTHLHQCFGHPSQA